MAWSRVRIPALCLIPLLLSPRAVAFAAQAAASLPPATAPAATVDAADVLRRLASDDWKQRQAAERELVRLGDDALPAIDAMLKGPGASKLDAETRARLEGARRQIADDRALGATSITLHLKDAAPVDAVAAFAKAAHGPLRPYPDNLFDHGQWPRVTLDFERVPFWLALGQLCDRLGITPNGWNDGLRLMPDGDGDGQIDGAWSIDGPFLVVANEVYRNQSIRLAGRGAGAAPARVAADEQDFGVRLAAFAEPKLTVLSCTETVILEEAVDNHGNSLLPEARNAPAGVDDPVYVINRGTVWDLDAPLRYPAKNPGTKIARLRGSVTFTLQSAAETIEMADPLRATVPVAKVVNGVAIEIQPMRKEPAPAAAAGNREGMGASYELKLSLIHAPGDLGRPDPAEMTLQQGLRILDDKGRPLHTRSRGSSSTDGRRTEYRLVYTAGRDEEGTPTGEPAKLVWEIPTGVKQRKATFDVKDLPMP